MVTPGPLFAILFYASILIVILLVVYWVIRLAVRHAIGDADLRRAKASVEAAATGEEPDTAP